MPQLSPNVHSLISLAVGQLIGIAPAVRSRSLHEQVDGDGDKCDLELP